MGTGPANVLRWAPIAKVPRRVAPAANLRDYDDACREFSWAGVRAELGLSPGSPLNIAQIAVDRQAQAAPDRLAVRFIDARLNVVDVTYGELQRQANRFANLLAGCAAGRGSVVATLLGRCPELFTALLGALKGGATFAPLFAACGSGQIRTRLAMAGASVLVTTARLYEREVAPIRPSLPRLRHVLVVRDDAAAALFPGTVDLAGALARQSGDFATAQTHEDDDALLHFTGGTTGRPRAVVHAHRAVIAHHATARLALDLHREDVFWCTADPGWMTGTSYGAIAPLSCGASMLVDRGELDVERWYTLLDQQQVSVWYTTPAAIRMLMQAGFGPLRKHRFPALRLIASAGEPLDPQAVTWGIDAFGLPVHDTWSQTETGAIMIANFAAVPIWPGSMGRAMPGANLAIARRRDDGSVELLDADQVGEIVLRPDWPSMFKVSPGDRQRHLESCCDGWYFSGDAARRDGQGNYWFVGRSDDVIRSAGRLVSPFEVECVLNQHPAVTQSAVIGVPDPSMGQIVKAVVELKPGRQPDARMQREILAYGRRLLGAAIAPRDVEFTTSLPRTQSGKILRQRLRA